MYAGWLSLTDYTLLTVGGPVWNDFANYIDMWSDPTFIESIWKTVRWTVSIVALQLLLALPVALFLNLRFKARGILRSIVFMPYVMPAAVVAVIWVYMFDSSFGVVNDLLQSLNLTDVNIAFLSSSTWSFWVLVLAMVWHGAPLMVIILLAALQSVRHDALEAAELDGAGRWKRFVHVVLPHLMPTIWLVVLLRTMWMAHHVETIALLTNGGPGTANYTMPMYSFGLATQDYDVAYGSAVAIVLSLMLLVLATIYIRNLERAKA